MSVVVPAPAKRMLVALLALTALASCDVDRPRDAELQRGRVTVAADGAAAGNEGTPR